jgi:hypothetical protein
LARITKVIVLFTRNPTKLVLRFYGLSTIFYVIYKFQPKVKHYLRIQLSHRPLELLSFHRYTLSLHKTPREGGRCNWVPGATGGGPRRNPARPAVLLAGKVVSYGPPWAHSLGGYQDRLLGGPLGLPGLRYTAPEGVEHKDYTGVVLG